MRGKHLFRSMWHTVLTLLKLTNTSQIKNYYFNYYFRHKYSSLRKKYILVPKYVNLNLYIGKYNATSGTLVCVSDVQSDKFQTKGIL